MVSLKQQNPEAVVKEIRRQTRRKSSTEENIRIVLEGLRGEVSIAELCRREGIVSNLYYRWSKDFLEAARSAFRGIQFGRRRTGPTIPPSFMSTAPIAVTPTAMARLTSRALYT